MISFMRPRWGPLYPMWAPIWSHAPRQVRNFHTYFRVEAWGVWQSSLVCRSFSQLQGFLVVRWNNDAPASVPKGIPSKHCRRHATLIFWYGYRRRLRIAKYWVTACVNFSMKRKKWKRLSCIDVILPTKGCIVDWNVIYCWISAQIRLVDLCGA